MANTLEETPEELVYAPAIPILAGDLYPVKLEIVREYIQNASDALDMFQRIASIIDDTTERQIRVSIQGRSLLIYDNGIGMDAEEIGKLRRIAYTEKKETEHAGHKGIGRLAGIGVASKLLISSTTYGDPFRHKFEFRAQDYQEELDENRKHGITEPATVVINRHTTITTDEVDPTDHYTLVELREIDERFPELLNPDRLHDYIAEMAPVGFAPDFKYGERITAKLFEHVPDFSPKTIWLRTAAGDRSQIYKAYTNSMTVAEPEFIEVEDPTDPSRLLAYCWYTLKGKEMLGKMRPSGTKFTVDGGSPEQKQRLAGLVYKLFGFSIGDRYLPLKTLWAKDYTRPLWFSGEIHIVNKAIKPTTDRSNFVHNEARSALFRTAADKIAKKLNKKAEDVSQSRKAFDVATKWEARFNDLDGRLKNGAVDRTELRAVKDEVREATEELKRKSKDKDIEALVKRVSTNARALERRLDEASKKKNAAPRDEISDLARKLKLTTQARAVFQVAMQTIERHFTDDRDSYFELAGKIRAALEKKL